MAKNTKGLSSQSLVGIMNIKAGPYQKGAEARRGRAVTARLVSMFLVMVFALLAISSGAWAQAAPVEVIGPMQILAIMSTQRCQSVPPTSQLNTAALAGAAGLDAFDNGVRTDVSHGQASAPNPVAGRASLLLQNLYLYGLTTMYMYDASWMARECIANGEGGRIQVFGFPKNIPGWETRRRTFFGWFYLRQQGQIHGSPLVKVNDVQVRACPVFQNNLYNVWGFSFTLPQTGQYNIEVRPNSDRYEFRSLTVRRHAVTP